MPEKSNMEWLQEAEQHLADLRALLDRNPDLQREKPGLIMQKFYLAMRELQNHLKDLTAEERERYDVLNEQYKNASGEVTRALMGRQ
jgi:hypothetical protein